VAALDVLLARGVVDRARLRRSLDAAPSRRGLRRAGRPGFPEQRLAVEHGGAWHGQPGQLPRDRRRLNRLTAAGRRVLAVTAADLHDAVGLLARIVAALGP
jgi:hypothetical protein